MGFALILEQLQVWTPDNALSQTRKNQNDLYLLGC